MNSSGDIAGVIYVIAQSSTGHLYIGSSVNHRRRWHEHRYWLRKGKHHSPKLQRAWEKYGENDFSFLIIQELKHEADLIFWEQFWLDRLKPWFNCRPTAESNRGYKRPLEVVEKTARANRGRRNTPEAIERMREAQLRRPPPSEEARRNMSEAGRRRVRRKEIFEKVAEKLRGRPLSEEHRRKLSDAHKGQKPTADCIARMIETRAKTWRFVDPEGQVVEIHNLMEFCRQHGLNNSSMQNVNAGRRHSHKGWRRVIEQDLSKGKAVEEVEAVE